MLFDRGKTSSYDFSERRKILILIILLGVLLRLLGIYWGISVDMLPNELPFHPDEVTTYKQSLRLYSQPNSITFTWGGALYYRIAYFIRWISTDTSRIDMNSLRTTLLWLRILNIGFSVLTVYFVVLISSMMLGKDSILFAAALMLFFPGHTLESHYARVDVLHTLLCSITLFFALKTSLTGRLKYTFYGACFSGLAVASMSWGIFTFLPLISGWFEYNNFRIDKKRLKAILFLILIILLGGMLGYLLGSIESLYYWDVFKHGTDRALLMHKAIFSIQVSKIAILPIFSFGILGVLLGYSGMFLTIKKKIPGGVTLLCYFLAGMAILCMQKNDMMRYVLFFSPLMAVCGAFTIVAILEKVNMKLKRIFVFIVMIFTFQLSFGYVFSMNFGTDIRHRAARWISNYSHKNGHNKSLSVGVALYFGDDESFHPRFKVSDNLDLYPILMRDPSGVSKYVENSYDLIVISDYDLNTAKGKTGDDLINNKMFKKEYKLIKIIKPQWYPISLGEYLKIKKPTDLLYSRLSFFIYQKIG